MPRAPESSERAARALENAFSELVLGPAIDRDDPASVSSWLERNGVAGPDAISIRTRSLPRMLVYRDLVRASLTRAIRLAMPRTLARLGERYGEYFDRFLEERAPQTHYLRDVADEFLEYCIPRWAEDPRLPVFLGDLARHESSYIRIGAQPVTRAAGDVTPLDLDRAVRFVEAIHLAHYRFAVHELPDDEEDRSVPTERPVHLLVYRSPRHRVRTLETTPAAAAILHRLLDGETLTEAIVNSTSNGDLLPNEDALQGTARLLADLYERGALLGAAPAPPPVG